MDNITKTCPCNIQRFFLALKIENFPLKIFDIFLIFAQNIDCVCMLEPVLTSTHNLCFGAKIRKIGIPLHTPVLLYKSGVQGGKRKCFHDEKGTKANIPPNLRV